MILLTGVTGLIGRATAEFLLGQDVSFRGLARDPEKAGELRDRGMELVQGDLAVAADMEKATRGVTSALLVTPNGERQEELERVFARAAASAGVGHLVKISTIRAKADASAPFPGIHYRSETFIKSLGMRWTMLRPNFFMQNFLMSAQSIANSGTFTLPVGRVQLGMIDARDVGEITAKCLLDTGRDSVSHDLSGPELLDFVNVAARMSAEFGRDIRYIEQSPEDFRAFIEKIIPNLWHVDALCAQFAEIASHPLGPVTDDAEQLLGRAPRRLESFLHDYSQAFAA
jgi:uncharacterized protein YbjT (DUF2867 family)